MKLKKSSLLVIFLGSIIILLNNTLEGQVNLQTKFTQSIEKNDAEKSFELLLTSQIEHEKVSAKVLEEFYEKFKIKMWGQHHGRKLWKNFIFLIKQNDNDMLGDEIIKDCIHFEYFKEPGTSPWRTPIHFPENSKISVIVSWIHEVRGLKGVKEMYSNALKAKKGDLALGIILNSPAVDDEETKRILALDRISAYYEISKIGIPKADLSRLVQDRKDHQVVFDDQDERNVFQITKYRDELKKMKNNNKITNKQNEILDKLSKIENDLAEN